MALNCIQRWEVAEDIVRKCDTVSILRPDEVMEIHAKAQAGEYDDYEVTA